MKLRVLLLFVGVFFMAALAACNQETLNEQHKVYLSNKGWEIKESTGVETYILDIPDEMLSSYEASGIFLSEYLGQEVTQYSYELKQKDIEGNRLIAVIVEAEGEIIGGYGALPSWTPGLFHLDDKERLINEQMIKQ